MITSTSNLKIKNVLRLLESSKARREQQVFVTEGVKLFCEAPADQIRQVFLTQACYERLPEKEKLAALPYEFVSDAVYRRISDTQTPQGVLCIMEKGMDTLPSLLQSLKGQAVHILVLEGIQDPGNLGTMLRTAEGAGFDFILADEKTVDVYNPKVIRSTMGSIFRVPVLCTERLAESITYLKSEHILLYAAHLHGEKDYREQNFSDRTAILIGNEGNGLSDEISALADILVKIPMRGNVESLNAAIAAALLMYEAVRDSTEKWRIGK
ncbi:MAG: RNA methyltransferase [Lachnospiraceae bacterium]